MGFAFDKYDDNTSNDNQKFPVFPQGTYMFEVESSTPVISKAGNKSLKLVLKIMDKEGFEIKVWDYLISSNAGLSKKKIKDFCYAVGLHEEYEKNIIPFDLSGLGGDVELDIQESLPNPKGGYYPEKNIVKNYIRQEPSNKNMIDEDIPF